MSTRVSPAKTAVPLRDLYLSIEEELYERIEDAIDFDWNEDFLSRSFCEILRKRSPFTFVSHDGEVSETNVVFKKNVGSLENNFGDIGALVTIVMDNGCKYVAWGYLEAKRRYTQSRRFDEIRPDQLERISNNAPHAMLLLYDFEDVRYNRDVAGESETHDAPLSHTAVVPIVLAYAMSSDDTDLYQSATPLAHQLCYRYLQGLDLKPVEHPDEISKFFGRLDLIPKYLLDITVEHEHHEQTPSASSATIPKEGGGGAAQRTERQRSLGATEEEERYA